MGHRLALAASLLALGLLAQDPPDPARLRARLAAGEAEAVRDVVVGLSRRGATIPLEVLLVGSEAALTVGDLGNARAFADQAEARAGEDPRPHTLNGHALWAMAERSMQRGTSGLVGATLADAAWHYAEARRLGGDPYENGFWEAEVRLLRGGHEVALEAIDAALAARPGDDAATRLKARILLASGEGGKATPLLEGLATRAPEDADVALMYLRAVVAGGDRTRARAVYRKLATRFPGSQDIHGGFYRAYEKDRPPTFLRETLEALTTEAPEVALPWWYLGWLRETISGDLEGALAAYERYRELVGGTAASQWHVGRLLVGLGRLDEAEVALLKAHALGGLDPADLAPSVAALVGAHVARNGFEKAASLQPLVLALDPGPEQQLNLGVLEFNSGRRDRGIDIYRQLLERDDVDLVTKSTAWNYLGLALWGTGRLDEARDALEKSLEEHDGNLDARENLGILLLETGKRDEAARRLREVLDRAPDRHRSRYHLMRARHPGLVEADTKGR